MDNRLTESEFIKYFEGIETDELMKVSIDQITLYDLMAEDLTVYLSKNDKSGFDLHIENESNQEIIETGIHPYAIESLATFCKAFLDQFNKFQYQDMP